MEFSLSQEPSKLRALSLKFDVSIGPSKFYQTIPCTHLRGMGRRRKGLGLVAKTPRRHHQTIVAKKMAIEGVSEDLNAFASQNMDLAPARRRVREAFIDLQQQLDHFLFKMAPPGIRTEEVIRSKWVVNSVNVGNVLDNHIKIHFNWVKVACVQKYVSNSRGVQIFCKSWLPRAGVNVKGAVCFCHGYGDTCTFFFEGIAKRIADSGYGVYAMDYPGFGLSQGLHGYIPSFDQLVDDVIEHFTDIKGAHHCLHSCWNR